MHRSQGSGSGEREEVLFLRPVVLVDKVFYDQPRVKLPIHEGPIVEGPIKEIKVPGPDLDVITNFPGSELGDNHGHGNNVEGIDISNPGGAFYFEEYEMLGDPLAFTTDSEDPFLATGADTELLQMAMTDPGLA